MNISYTNILKWITAAIVVVGICMRFTDLDSKPFWYDETMGALRSSGYLEEEILTTITYENVTTVESFLKYQQLKPQANSADTVRALAANDPQHPPLYYTLSNIWMTWFGDSVAVRRSLSAALSLVALPCVYWLCLELFQSATVSYFAVILGAVSPLYLIYAQEARQYSLWLALTPLCCAALLRALRINSRLSWFIYMLSLSLGFLTHLFFAFIAIAHSIYICFNERFQLTNRLRRYFQSLLACAFIILPWGVIVFQGMSIVRTTTSYTTESSRSLSYLWKLWLLNLSRFLLDFDLSLGENHPLIYLAPLFAILVSYAVYFCYRNASFKSFFFTMLLVSINVIGLVIPDFVLGGIRSSSARYFMVSYLGIQLLIAYLLAIKTEALNHRVWFYRAWRFGAVALIVGAFFSCNMNLQASTWWNKNSGYFDPEVANIINASPNPLVISDAISGMILSLSHQLKPEISLQIQPKCRICHDSQIENSAVSAPTIPEGFDYIFFYRPSKALQDSLADRYKLDLIYRPQRSPYEPQLWRLHSITDS
ncbi:MAG: glycosyltransferase family 39 protein [Leptolyngbyaceae cyanobacterium MO_188.B28]|nr:glycosyltransferase family 39 protein [Leptolyngbyaceae cyanobacterium MO_188.B28]